MYAREAGLKYAYFLLFSNNFRIFAACCGSGTKRGGIITLSTSNMNTTPTIKSFLSRAAMTLGGRQAVTLAGVMTRRFTVMITLLLMMATAWAVKPTTNLDACRGEAYSIYVKGWAFDKDAPDYSLSVKVYVYSDAACKNEYTKKTLYTGYVDRPDVVTVHSLPSGSKPGFEGRIPITDPGTYYVKVYAIDIDQWGDDVENSSTEMSNSFNPVTVTTLTTIGSAADWNTFVTVIKSGEDFAGKTLTLTADIPTAEEIAAGTTAVTTMTSEEKAFCGTFDGQGHTINVDLNASGNTATGLFSYVKGATIKDLTVTGTINNSGLYAGGLVGTAKGATIQNCTLAATINSSGNEVGAFVGGCSQIDADTPGNLTLQDCIFSGSIHITGSYGDSKSAGLVSVWNNTSLTISNCLVKGSFSSERSGAQFYPIAFKTADATVTANVSETYYLNTLPVTTLYGPTVIPEAEGTAVSTTETEEYDIPVTAADGNSYYYRDLPLKTVISSTTEWLDGYTYNLIGDVTISSRIIVNGTVTLNLCEGCTLTASEGIDVSEGNTLTIEGKGSLNATGKQYTAGIGGGESKSGGTITIGDGTVTATGGKFGAGIGGGSGGAGGTINISGGTVTATGADQGAGIGGGLNSAGGTIIISDGNVTATGGRLGAGIGSGSGGDGATITISGGTINANGGELAAGIGGGTYSAGGTINISDGNITATGGRCAAGIGGGAGGDGGEITISDGDVTATGGEFAAGIGGGTNYAGGTITISAGNVTAIGGRQGAGIGGGTGGDGGTITISGGTVTATGSEFAAGIGGSYAGGTITISDGNVTATGGKFAAGIGSGPNYPSGTITISGGSITATGGQYAAYIGSGDGGTCEKIIISGGKVTANAGEECIGIGAGYRKETSGTVTLGWTNDDDYIYASSYHAASIEFANDLYFTENNEDYRATQDNIDGKKLLPAASNSLKIVDVNGIKRRYLYTGNELDITYEVIDKDGNILREGVDYTGTFSSSTFKEVGDYTLTISAVDGGAFIEQKTIPFSVMKFDLKDAIVTGVRPYYLYTGKDIELAYTVTGFEGSELTKGVEYTASIDKIKNKGNYTLTLTAASIGYTGSRTFNMTVGDGIPVTAETAEMSSVHRVTADVTINERITITGDVTLNLDEGKTLNATKGIELSEGNKLTIVGKGTLNATTNVNSYSGIGAHNVGTLVIEGGIINASGGYRAAGIGGNNQNNIGGDITINGGTVTATGGADAPGIGGGMYGKIGSSWSGMCGTITINGGKVTATGNGSAPGIGATDGAPTGGSITLGWTNQDDFIYSSGYGNVSSISFAEGKYFYWTENGVNTIATTDNIGGKKMFPLQMDKLNDLEYLGVSGVEPYYLYTGNDISIAYEVTDFDKNKLVKGTHYTESYSSTPIKNEGDYTLTLTAINGSGYTGTRQIHFTVGQGVPVTAETTKMTLPYYSVPNNVTVNERIVIQGDVRLYLYEGKKLYAAKGIEVSDGNKLTIEGTGSLIAEGSEWGVSGIGAKALGTIVINGGIISAKGDSNGAGIGGNNMCSGGTIIINGGKVVAQGGQGGAGIGGGSAGECGTIIINGGRVGALSGNGTTDAQYAPGIGAGYNPNNPISGSVTLGWTNLDDRVISVGYRCSIIYAKAFVDDSGGIHTPKKPGTLADGQTILDPAFALADDADNTDAISKLNDVTILTALDGRTLYRNGEWNTLTVPFDVNDFTGTPLQGATVNTLSSTDYSDGTLTLNFEDATSIKAGKPYIVKWADVAFLFINSNADWEAFAESVNGGNTYKGKSVLLGADIDVSKMVGTAEHPFCGTFDGAGHTLNLSLSDTNDGTAPFRYISGATIRNLRTSGSVAGGDYCAGIVGIAQGGTNTIHNCEMQAAINGTGKSGGIVGKGCAGVTTTVHDCALKGSITATSIGIVYGWGEAGGTHGIENCFVSGGPYTSTDAIDLLLAETGADISVTNCYRTKSYGCTQGDYSLSPSSYYVQGLGNQWELVDGAVTLKMPTSTAGLTNVENPVFTGVTIDADAETSVETNYVDFIGIYAPLTFAADDHSILCLGNNDNLLYSKAGDYIGAQCAYFKLDDSVTAARRFVLNFGDGKTVTGTFDRVGDANGDGKVDAADIVEMVNAMNGKASDKFVLKNVDFDGSGNITQSDIDAEVNYILKK